MTTRAPLFALLWSENDHQYAKNARWEAMA